jgi:Flp pilus assembly protein TadG
MNSQGSVTAEFVISLPLILLALVFVFEFGSLFWAHHVAVNNVRDAIRFLSRAPLTSVFLTQATNIARTGNSATSIGIYDWMKKTCADGGICININQSAATFSATDFRSAGQVIRIEADVPFPMPLFGLVNAFSNGTIPQILTLHIVEETRYFGE